MSQHVKLKTNNPSRGHLKNVSKSSGVSVKKLRKMIHNFKTTKWKPTNEDAPTNSMGASSTTSGPIQTYDPLLFANKKKKQVLKRFSSFLQKIKT